MYKWVKVGFLGLMAVGFAGCTARVEHGQVRDGARIGGDVLLAPFINATDEEFAGTAVTELMGAELVKRGVGVTQASDIILLKGENDGKGDEGGETGIGGGGSDVEVREVSIQAKRDVDVYAKAKQAGVRYVVMGTVVEYRYKTDLDGDPAVGVSVKVVDAESRKVVWHGSGSHVGIAFSSLTSTAQQVVQDVVRGMLF